MAAKDLNSDDNIKNQEVDDITTCCICTEVYTDPKALPCIHTFCMKCIEEAGFKTNKGPGDEMPCPVCRRLFKIPPEGFRGLPKHFFIERLIQLSKVSDPLVVSRALCTLCLEESNEEEGKEIPTADTYCVDCKCKLCAECCSEHKKFKMTKNHKLIPLNEYESSQNVTNNLTSSACKLHRQKVLDVFCSDCKTVVCAICFIEDHKNHEGSHVDKLLTGFQKQIESNAEAINDCRCKAQKRQAELLQMKEDIQERVEKLQCDIENRKAEVKQLVEKHAASLLHKLCSIKQSKLKEIQMVADDIGTYLSSIDTYNLHSQKIMANGSASQICGSFSDLTVTAVELQRQCLPTIDKDIQFFDFCFRKLKLEEFLEEGCGNLIGEIEDSSVKMCDIEEERIAWKEKKDQLIKEAQKLQKEAAGTMAIYVEKPKLVKNIFLGHSVWGMAMLNKELFVASADDKAILVYDTVAYKMLRKIDWKGPMGPRDIVAHEQKNCLFAVDLLSGLSLFRLDQNGNTLKKWKVPYEPHNLSVTPSGDILLTCNARILIYNSDGNKMKSLRLDENAFNMSWQTILLRSGNYLVCQGWLRSKYHRALILNPEGVILKSFGSEKKHSNSHLADPIYMAIGRDESVIVADCANNRVILLNKELVFQRELISEKDGVNKPYRVLLDETSKLLYVGTNYEELLIYNVLQ